MQQLFPSWLADVELGSAYGTDHSEIDGARPHVTVNMVTSCDGAIAVEGRTAGLGSPGDRRIFLFLRTLADVILVGAQTVRAEGYGPPRLSEEERARRVERGQAEYPRVAVVSRSLALDWSGRLFTQPTSRPILLAPATTDEARLAEAGRVADVLVAGASTVDLAVGLAALGRIGAAVVLCEGGPTLNAELAEADLIDELCLTVAPSLVGNAAGVGLVGAARLAEPIALSLRHVLEEDGSLFLRYRRGVGP